MVGWVLGRALAGAGTDSAAAVRASIVPLGSSFSRFWNSSTALRVDGPKNLRLISGAEIEKPR
jgi:hypothetical protein